MSRNLHVPGHSNPSANPTFDEVLSRRSFLKGALGAAVAAALPGCATQGAQPRITFTSVAPSGDDLFRVPPEYEARVLFRWGDPVGIAGAAVAAVIALASLGAMFWNEDYRPGVYGVAAFYVIAIVYFAFAGRHKLVLSPEEEFALTKGTAEYRTH